MIKLFRNRALALVCGAFLIAPGLATAAADQQTLDRGRYMVAIGGCNDCHTDGFNQSGGNMPEEEWLSGSGMGWQGPWGTTYPANLRLKVQEMDAEQWVVYARTERRPPMPWWALRDMTDEDLTAMYHYIHSLGAKGEAAPAYVPPGGEVQTPYLDLMPKNLPQ